MAASGSKKPGALLKTISYLYTEGFWSINGETYKEGSVLTIWIIEALILGIFTSVMVVMQVEKPFSESQNVWLHPYLLNQRLPPLHQKTSHIWNPETLPDFWLWNHFIPSKKAIPDWRC